MIIKFITFGIDSSSKSYIEIKDKLDSKRRAKIQRFTGPVTSIRDR